MILLRWLARFIGWDGILPVFLWFVPSLIELVVPNQPDLVLLGAAVVPIMAFLGRYFAGRSFIKTSRCGELVRKVQWVCFVIGIMLLAMIDCLIMLAHVMGADALIGEPVGRLVCGCIFASYLILMAISTFPGIPPESSPQFEWIPLDKREF